MPLTPAGVVLSEHSDELLMGFEQTLRAVREIDGRVSMQLRVGIADGRGQPVLSRRPAQWRTMEPRTDFVISEVRATDRAAGLLSQELDVGFSFDAELEPGLVQDPVWSYSLAVLVPYDHPLASHTELMRSQVLAYPMVACDPYYKSGVYRQIDVCIRRDGASPKIASLASSLAGSISKIGVGCGIGRVDVGHMLAVNRVNIVSIPMRHATASLTPYVLYMPPKNGLSPVQPAA